MGTLIPFKQIKQQWKAIVVALGGLAISVPLILLVGALTIGYPRAVAGAGPLSGGIIAYLVTAEGLTKAGLDNLVVIAAAILGIQGLVGLPLAGNILRRYAIKLREKIESGEFDPKRKQENYDDSPHKSLVPDKYDTSTVMLFRLFLGGFLAIVIGYYTHVSYSVWALIIGIIGAYTGFYRSRMLVRANSFGIAMAALIIYVLGSMNNVTPELFVREIPSVVLILVVGIIGIIIGASIVSKLVKWDKYLGIPVALTALFGFPGDYILCEEVARSVGKNEEQEKIIFDEILAPMLVGGFTTVTTTSILVASILVKTL